ncbi:MAG TPA: 2Fe-2S iron-sulfur cluster-binding protein, partial [Candidatus Hydrogenedentes bacterium]|nr:2Fe-2S iron-sulfur cluster-binding protein [Candidatus Hydrogenedentota bacterium]
MSAAEITTITLNIDGRTVEAQPGETILDCALRNGIEIPHLCAETGLTPHGGCRMCLVEVDGMRGYPPSCATPVTPGMNVRTDTPQLRRLRRNVLALMMLEHPNACLLCGHRQECEAFRPAPEKVGSTTGCHTCNNKPECYVRNLAEQLELTELPIAPEYHHRPVERAQPFLDRDLNLCILCGRCVRVCREQHGKAVIDFIGRGSQARIGQAFDMSLLEAGCTFCGSCVDACPTGTLSDRYAKWWGAPDRRVATTCAFCPEACAMTVAAQEGRVISTRALAVGHPLCVVGRFAVAEFHNGKNRLTRPLMRVKSMQRPTDWKPAMEAAAARLAHFTGEAFALVCDDSLTLEDRLALKRFTRAIMDAPESHYIELRRDSRGRTPLAELPESVRAVWVTGPFIDPAAADGLDVLIVSDAYPSALSEKADFVFPATLFAETEGTILDRAGALRPLRPAAAPPGDALADWQIAVRLSRALGSEGLAWESSAELTREVQGESAGLWLQRDRPPEAALDLSKRVAWFRGHRIEEQVSGLLELPPLEDCPLPADASEKRAVAKAFQTAAAGANPDDGRFRIVSLRELVPNTYEVVLSA